jgi:hypothetical protein
MLRNVRLKGFRGFWVREGLNCFGGVLDLDQKGEVTRNWGANRYNNNFSYNFSNIIKIAVIILALATSTKFFDIDCLIKD